MSAALTLARAHRHAVVFDAGTPRNAASPGVRGFLSRDGIHPGELRRIARNEIAAYGGIDFRDVAVSRMIPAGATGGFRIDTRNSSSVTARYVLITTGMIDCLPRIEGLSRHWGRDAIHCEFCHGWENADRRWATIISHPGGLDTIDRLLNWSQSITAIVPSDLQVPKATVQRLARKCVVVERGQVSRLVTGGDGKLAAVELADGRRISCETVIFHPKQVQSPIVLDLGLTLDGEGRVVVDETFESGIAGIFAAGDLVPGPQTVLNAAASGAAVGRRLAFLLSAGSLESRRGIRAA